MNMQAVNKNPKLYSFCQLRYFLLLYTWVEVLYLGVSSCNEARICGISGVYGPDRSGHPGAGQGAIMRGVWKPIQGSQRRK